MHTQKRSSSTPAVSETSPLVVRPSEETTAPTKYWTSRRIIVIVAICSVQFCAFTCFAMLAPFFPGEANKRGVSVTVTGLIFSTMSLVQLVVSPLIGKVHPLVGAKFLLLTGMYSASLCMILFGTLEYSPYGITFIVLCFVVRAFLAISVAAFATAAYSLLIREFADKMGTVLGIVQTFLGLGMTLGPAIGGFLFTAGGFQLPFYVTGGMTLVCAIFNTFMAKQITDTKERTTGSYTQLFKVQGLIAVTVCCVMSGGIWTFLDPTLERRMNAYGLSQLGVSHLFLLMSGCYTLSSLLIGKISDRMRDPFILSPIGLAGCAIALFLLAPAKVLGFSSDYRELWLVIVSLVILGSTNALGTVPTFSALLQAALSSGMENNIMTFSLVSGWWTASNSLGDFMGTSLGALLVDSFGFQEGCTITGGVCLGLSSLAILYKCVVVLLKRRSQCATEASFPTARIVEGYSIN